MGSPEAYVRATSEPVAAMELTHTFGVEPLSRSAGYHSYNTAADTAAGDLHRGYNTSLQRYVPDARSVMKYTSPGWTSDDVLLEPADWSNLLCQLGGQTTAECTTSSTAGTAVGVAAAPPGPAFNINAVVTGGAVNILETFVAPTFPTQPGPASSPYTLVQMPGSIVTKLPFSTDETSHAFGGVDLLNKLVTGDGLISASVPLNSNTTSVKVMNGSTTIGTFDAAAPAPAVTNATVSAGGAGTVQLAAGGSASGPHVTLTTPPLPPKPDVLFLADTTGSMGAALDNVKANIGNIMTNVLSSQPSAGFGAANYRDVTCDPATAYTLNQSITTTTADVSSAVGSWLAGGGCDTPEDQLNALYLIAADTPSVGWRSGSTRIIAWFGDSNGHDPSNGHSLADVIDTLKNAQIRVIAVPVSGSGNGLTTADAGTNDKNQPAEITSATGGSLASSTDASGVAAAITAGLHNLPTTVDASYTCTSTHLSVQFDANSKTVTSGDDASFTDTIKADSTTPAGSYTCTLNLSIAGIAKATQDVTVDVASFDGPYAVISWNDATVNDKYDLVLDCGSVKNVLAVALTAKSYDTNASCPDGGGTYKILANNGYAETTTTAGTVPANLTPAPVAVASIQSPTSREYSQFDAVPLRGSATADGTPIADLNWTVDGNSVSGSAPNVEGLGVGTHNVVLTAGGATTATTVTISSDADHDGLVASDEQALQACAATRSITDGGDNDPLNGSKDYDGDGIVNRDDPAPCVAETNYRGQGIFVPNPFSVGSSTSISASGIYVPGRALAQVDKNSVKITEIGGIPLATPIAASAWAASGALGAGTFPKAPFVAFVTDPAHNFVGHTVSITLKGVAPSWTFAVVMSVKIVS